MANKVVNIGKQDTTSSLSSDEIYIDIDMNSSLVYDKIKDKPNYYDYYCYLAQEGHPLDELFLIITEDKKIFPPKFRENLLLCYVKYGNYEEALKEWEKSLKNYRINKSVNVRAVQNSLDNIFNWIPGERILNPEFGSKLHEYLYEGITDYNEEMIAGEIKYSIQRWEPRVIVTQIINQSSLEDRENNTIVLDIKYYIKGLPDRIFDKQYIFNRNI